jgi:hypothetical protein
VENTPVLAICKRHDRRKRCRRVPWSIESACARDAPAKTRTASTLMAATSAAAASTRSSHHIQVPATLVFDTERWSSTGSEPTRMKASAVTATTQSSGRWVSAARRRA